MPQIITVVFFQPWVKEHTFGGRGQAQLTRISLAVAGVVKD